MPIAPMDDAVPGTIASSADYNILIDNIEFLEDQIALSQDIYAKYYRTTNQSNALVAATWTKQAFNVALETHAQVTPDAGFDDWTLNLAGVWEIHASIRCNVTNVDPVRYQIGIFPTGFVSEGNAYMIETFNEPLASSNSTNIGVYVKDRFAAGTQLCVAANRTGNSGAGGGNNASTEAMGRINQISFSYVGP